MVSRPSDVSLDFDKRRRWGILHSVNEYIMLLSHLALFSNAHVVEISSLDMPPHGRCKQPSDFDFGLPQLGQHSTVREVRLRRSGPLPFFHIFPSMEVLRMHSMHTSFEKFDWRQWACTESVPLVDVTADNDDQLVCLAGMRAPTVRRLHLHAGPSRGLGDDFNAACLRPICFVFAIEWWDAPWNTDLPIWSGPLEAIASPAFGGRLRYLEVTAKCHPREETPDLGVDLRLPALRESTLVCMRLNVEVGTLSRDVSEFDGFRMTLAKAVPSLRYVCISVDHNPQTNPFCAHYTDVHGECAWWRVRGRAGVDSERISCEAGERVEEYLHSAEFERTMSLEGLRLDDG
ncbi:uncharacterized protein B0H18DRAFT_56925 [Fomitopsis serialis]|uniref:uncharacterized protein n=1 Tax=Fomitopsis serialis TaxID=139415 RepID=UPI00200828FD|nr:uncharacterized protein B0H18DRAFT_56925 [Neoantrodia serialis]KAH9916881.1 hypothetical protein B0H18DRAFT_56925 [Neoantrodia serialis]